MALPTRTIDRDLLLGLSYGDSPADCGWLMVENNIIGTWRWGNEYSLVLQDLGDGTYWGINYRKTSGDESHNDLQDLDNPAQLYPMVAEKVTVIKFRDMKESDAAS